MNARDSTCRRNGLPLSSSRAPYCGDWAPNPSSLPELVSFFAGGDRCPAHTVSFVSARYTNPSAAMARNSDWVDAPSLWMSSSSVNVTVEASNEQFIRECTSPK